VTAVCIKIGLHNLKSEFFSLCLSLQTVNDVCCMRHVILITCMLGVSTFQGMTHSIM